MIFDELSNAFLRLSLRRLGTELDGGVIDAPAPLADHGSFGAPARRGLINNQRARLEATGPLEVAGAPDEEPICRQPRV